MLNFTPHLRLLLTTLLMIIMILNVGHEYRRLCVRAAGVCAIFSRVCVTPQPNPFSPPIQDNPDNDRGG